MEAETNYFAVWLVYLAAAACFFLGFWLLLRRLRWVWLRYLIHAVAMALVFTPWFANTEDWVVAPALVVVALDAITQDTDAARRSLIPLAVSLVFAVGAAITCYVKFGRARARRDPIPTTPMTTPEIQETSDAREAPDARQVHEAQGIRETQKPPEPLGGREAPETREPLEGRETQKPPEPPEAREAPEARKPSEGRETQDTREPPEGRETQDT